MLQISEHYLPYPPKTYIVVASADRARVFVADDRTVEEAKLFEAQKTTHTREHSVYQDGSADNQELEERHALYRELGAYLLKAKPAAIILCTPEAQQQEIKDQLPTDVQKAITLLVPKNLASLPIDAIVRILQERQA